MMRVPILAFLCLLVGAAPAEVPVGTFLTWLSFKKASLSFTSGEVTVRVSALPCPSQPAGESTCRWNGYNNQAAVTVSAPGVAPVSVTSDPASGYARIAVVRFQRTDLRPGVIVESQSGGAGGDMTAQLLVPSGNGYRAVAIDRRDGAVPQGEVADFPRNLSGDGAIDLKLGDGRFAYGFGCGACTPRPPLLFAVKNGELVDESRDPALRGVFAADMARLAPICLSRTRYRNGACAAYVADAARAGRFEASWAAMLTHYEHDEARCGEPPIAEVAHRCAVGTGSASGSFPDALRAFLKRTGYLPA